MKRIVFGSLAILGLFPIVSMGAAPALGWPEVITDLTTERRQAETCVGLIKARGDTAAVENAKATYVLAKAEMDGIIAGLETVLAEGGKPGSLPTVRPSLETTTSSLKAICAAAFATSTPHTRGVSDEIAKGIAEGAVEPVVNKISDAISAVWTHYVVDPDRLALETRKSKLEAARWPRFGDIAAP
jgi:hypothetical protein